MPRHSRSDPAYLPVLLGSAQATAAGISPTMVAARLRTGAWTSLYRGHYERTWAVPATGDSHADEVAAHVARAVAAARANPSSVIALESAAALLDLPLTRRLPELPQLIRMNGHGKVRHRVHVHQQKLEPDDYVVSTTYDGCLVTTALRTFADIARTGRLGDAHSVGDRAVRLGLFTPEDARARALASSGRGVRTLRLAAQHLDGAHETPLESLSYAAFLTCGLPLPESQVPFVTRIGQARVDFYWRDQRVIGEADGAGKYTGRDDLVAEKRREDALRELGMNVVRWTWSDLSENFTETMVRLAHALGATLAPDSPSPLFKRSMSYPKD